MRLPYSYTIIGTVTDGVEAIDAIAGLPLAGEKPTEDAVIKSVAVTESSATASSRRARRCR